MTGETVANDMSCPHSALRAGEGSRAAARIDHAHLAQMRFGVRLGQLKNCPLGRRTRGHQVQATRPVGQIGMRLRRHGACTGPRPRYDGADGRKLGLNGGAPLSTNRIIGDDRKGGDRALDDAAPLHRGCRSSHAPRSLTFHAVSTRCACPRCKWS